MLHCSHYSPIGCPFIRICCVEGQVAVFRLDLMGPTEGLRLFLELKCVSHLKYSFYLCYSLNINGTIILVRLFYDEIEKSMKWHFFLLYWSINIYSKIHKTCITQGKNTCIKFWIKYFFFDIFGRHELMLLLGV